jgi:hypothetical protein
MCTSKPDLPALDAEIYELEQRLLLLKRRRNSTSIIYRLPNDIFGRILRLVQAQDDSGTSRYTDSEWTGINKKWGRAMLICKRFREAALQITSLWAVIDTTIKNKEWHELCLQRAGTHELDLYGCVKYQDDESTKRTLELIPKSSAIRIVIPDVDPIEPLTQDDIEGCIDRLINHHIYKEQPLLRRLELFNETMNEERYWCHIGRTFLGGVATYLTHLLLDGCNIGDIPPLTSLNRLILRAVRVRSDCYYLTGLLHKAPNLNFLRIQEPVINQVEPLTWPAGTAHFNETLASFPSLSQLEVLQLSGRLESIGSVIHVLPIPKYNLDICVQDPHDDDTAILVNQADSEMSKLSYRMYSKAVQFIQQEMEHKSTARHTIEVNTCDDAQVVTRVVMSSEKLDHKTFGMSLRLVFSTESDKYLELNKLIRYADTFVVPQHPAQLFHNESLLKQNAHIQHLVIENATCLVKAYPDMHMDTDYIQILERIFSFRAQNNEPLWKLEFRFKGAKSDHLTSYYDGVITYGKSLQDAGWVLEVVYTYTE